MQLNSKKLFLIDCLGALLSAFILGVVLVKFESYLGIPKNTLYFLAIIPCLFALFDIYCLIIVRTNIQNYLKVIAFANLAYCAVSLSLAFYHSNTVSLLGWSYIFLEIIIILVIAALEFNTAKKIVKNQ